ncbi:hypothetical protein [Jiangella endophytica]|uniref:hypothetical protein n=1 Tax=Jiangella endophytica TaxID=1623398 RepID=UPI00130078E3|nr:hypothetical protein [Jiangella endophytica]
MIGSVIAAAVLTTPRQLGVERVEHLFVDRADWFLTDEGQHVLVHVTWYVALGLNPSFASLR